MGKKITIILSVVSSIIISVVLVAIISALPMYSTMLTYGGNIYPQQMYIYYDIFYIVCPLLVISSVLENINYK